MFDYIFKRSAKTAPAASQPVPKTGTATANATQVAKQMALEQAAGLGSDESAAVDFILQCPVADARLQVAAQVQSKPMLERVLHAMRNTDRRVAKLMQTRLDEMQRQQVTQQKAAHCVDEAVRLTQAINLMPNQVADLDRSWQAIKDAPDTLRTAFDDARATLRSRLEAQAALQRAVIDALARVRQLAVSAETMAPADIAQALDALRQEMTRHGTSSELASLPKQLLPEFDRQYAAITNELDALTRRYQTNVAREDALTKWEAADLASLQAEPLKRAWNLFPTTAEDAAIVPLQARFEALLAGVAALRSGKDATAKVRQDGKRDMKEVSKESIAQILESMEKALQEGALQTAVEHDKALRAIDFKAAQLSEAQAAQLAVARSELSRLQGWAKWGGNISREELLKAAESLPAKELAALELAKKVGSLRERWKSLDVSAGSAAKDLWERFDAACTTAYAPAAAHFKRLADERHGNQEKAQAMITELTQFASASDFANPETTAIDWKEIANHVARATQAWHRLGTIDRKEKKRLDAEFALTLKALTDPLTLQRQIEIKRREKLIADASDLNPTDRTAVDTLRTLQERWQEQAKSLPLERKDEQELWQRFRSTCDAVFAKRKETAIAADADRRQHLEAKEALCATLESTLSDPETSLAKVLRETREAWSKVGPVPRASEHQIEMRYKSAVDAVQQQLDRVTHAAQAAQADALRNKLALCQSVEAALLADTKLIASEIDGIGAKWSALPSLSNVFERALRQRFDAALTAHQTDSGDLVALLDKNRAMLAHEVLRFEIVSGVESPAVLSRERLQLQVEVLQSSLKAGQKQVSQEAQLLCLCGLPALVDAAMVARIDRLIAKFQSIA